MSLISYNIALPVGADTPATNRPGMTTNTAAVNQILSRDMIGFNVSNSGYHSMITYVDQASDPGSLVGAYREYSKLSNSESETFVQKDGVSTPIQLTRGTPILPSGSVAGCTYLPGGLYLLYGNIGINPSGTLTFPAGVTLTNLYSFSATSDQPVSLYKSASSSTSITISRVSGTGSVGAYITVIGN